VIAAGHDAQREEFARTGLGHLPPDPGQQAAPAYQGDDARPARACQPSVRSIASSSTAVSWWPASRHPAPGANAGSQHRTPAPSPGPQTTTSRSRSAVAPIRACRALQRLEQHHGVFYCHGTPGRTPARHQRPDPSSHTPRTSPWPPRSCTTRGQRDAAHASRSVALERSCTLSHTLEHISS
jgi:hypothetical protein